MKTAREILDSLDLCRCGTDAEFRCVRDILEEAKSFSERKETEGMCVNPWKEFAAKVLDGWGLIEHGTTINFAWITEDGRSVLNYLQTYGTSPSNWPNESVVHG